jgi:hypothetical protein
MHYQGKEEVLESRLIWLYNCYSSIDLIYNSDKNYVTFDHSKLRYFSAESINFESQNCGVVGRTYASFSGGPGFKISAQQPVILTTKFVVLPSPSSQVVGYYLMIIHDRSLPFPNI